ncbi:hypothetical protein [Mesonia aestuariivivens]|uniref:Uncharacterized protein n=1 Tax=Mesonia aestuariivivens TaxID=2796128 RepID=A0ABS6W385_9FLAO|nr:hypothetical protein [Mesonia aestuariivivens]MBW2962320.1 hypothetical protein [Mesonia aestuariivivens]
MKIDKTSVFALVLVFGLIASVAYNYQQSIENKALKNSNSIIDNQLEEKKETNFINIDSLDEVKEKILDSIEILRAEKLTIQKQMSNLDKKQTQDEKVIRNMRDADSIQQLFSRYYPDHD